MTTKPKRTSTYLPIEVEKTLSKMCTELGLPISEAVKEAVVDYLPKLDERIKIMRSYRPGQQAIVPS